MQINYSGFSNEIDTQKLKSLIQPGVNLGCLFNRYWMLFLGSLFWFIAIKSYLQPTNSPVIGPKTWLLIGAVYFIIAGVQFYPNVIRQKQKQDDGYQITGVISEGGIIHRTNVGEANLKWNGFIGYKNNGFFLLLYITDNQIIPLPRSFFTSQEDWNAALLLTKSNLTDLAQQKHSSRLWVFIILMLILIGAYTILSIVFRFR